MSLFRKISLPLIILFYAQITVIDAQAQKLSFTTFDNANGLSQNTINVSFKDHYGFMWFGTQDGLNKYDGYKVTVYKHRSNDKKTLPTNFITSICEDQNGDLWIGTRIGGLSKYNRSKDDFTNFVHKPSISSSLSDNNIKFIYTDSFRLRQILTNIVGNAIKFTSRGEVAIRVSCDNVGEDAINLLFTVRDTGIGIPPEKIDSLFNAFNQVDSSITRKYGGSGLGLVICERLLKLFGGEITVESEFGTGSVFSFNIICGHTKCIENNENESSTGINFEKKVRDNEGAKKEVNLLSERLAIAFPFTMLVAEDNLMNQKLMIRILNKLGYQPDLANDGLEVLELMKTTKYDIILMDIQMPNLDGLETTRVIRHSYGEKPLILAMTANALTEDKISCYQAGMDGYLSKPVNLELLITTLKNMYNAL